MIFLEPYKQYVTISGRATRKEYWVFVFFICVVASWLLALDNFLFPDTELGEGWTFLIFSAFSTIPYCTVTVRRLHDADRSGWWFFAGFLPLICFLPMYFLCVVSTPGDNRFGEQSPTANLSQSGLLSDRHDGSGPGQFLSDPRNSFAE